MDYGIQTGGIEAGWKGKKRGRKERNKRENLLLLPFQNVLQTSSFRSLPYILLSFSFHSYLDERRERWEEAEEGDWKWRYKRCV